MKEFKLFATLIQVAFIVMKLCGAIHWSWLLVFSPILLYLVWMAFRFVFSVFYIKHEIKKSRESFRNRMENLKRLQQEAINKKKKELEEK
nr:MAG TPA: Selenoprotein S (SelS) [Caudoviricetes sp.]